MAKTVTIQNAKQLLRQEIKSRIQTLTTIEKERQSKIVLEKVVNLPAYRNSTRISVYLSTSDEVDTSGVIADMFSHGKQCFVPRYHGSVMEMVKLNSVEDLNALPVTKWNIRQPAIEEIRENALETGGLDLVITPGVGFSREGARLGHGKGYYDAFLSGLQPKAATIALAFVEQIQPEIPTHEHDVIIDNVLSAE